MAYVTGNPKSKKELKAALESGKRVEVFSPGPFDCKKDGVEFIEGPQYPEPHKWYAKVEVRGGVVIKILS